MGCDYYRKTYLVVVYQQPLCPSQFVEIKNNFKHDYYNMSYEDSKLSILLSSQPIYCACYMRSDPLLDTQPDHCSCVVSSKETLTSNNYGKLLTSLTLEGNDTVSVERIVETERRY